MARAKKQKAEVESILKDKLTSDEPIMYKDSDILECKITKAFMDKYTEKLYEVGKIEKFTFKRIKEIKAKNEKYLKIIEK